MKYQVLFLHQTEQDLKELREYIIKNFSEKSWKKSLNKIKNIINILKTFPLSGNMVPELEELGLNQYRQIISYFNKIIYEIS